MSVLAIMLGVTYAKSDKYAVKAYGSYAYKNSEEKAYYSPSYYGKSSQYPGDYAYDYNGYAAGYKKDNYYAKDAYYYSGDYSYKNDYAYKADDYSYKAAYYDKYSKDYKNYYSSEGAQSLVATGLAAISLFALSAWSI